MGVTKLSTSHNIRNSKVGMYGQQVYAHTTYLSFLVHASCTTPNVLFWQHCHVFFCLCASSVSFFKNPFIIHFPENSCAMHLVFSTNCPCIFPSCKVFFLSCLFLFEISSFVSLSSTTFSFSAPLSITYLRSFR